MLLPSWLSPTTLVSAQTVCQYALKFYIPLNKKDTR